MDSERPLSYDCLVSVMRHLSYSKRVELSLKSEKLRKIHNRLPWTIEHIKFSQVYGSRSSYREWRTCDADLQIESIKYTFRYDEFLKVMDITNSLILGQVMRSQMDWVARSYFQFFLQNSERPVQHVDIDEAHRPFRGMENLKIPSIKWRVWDMHLTDPLFAQFDKNHVFDKLELAIFNPVLLKDPFILNCKELIITNTYSDGRAVTYDKTEPLQMMTFQQSKKMFKAKFLLQYRRSFVNGCNTILTNNLEIGSYFTGVFYSYAHAKKDVWKAVLWEFKTSGVENYDETECVILQVEEDYTVLVIKNYHGKDTETQDSYTVIKMANPIEALWKNDIKLS